jgi:hypothetical protein
MSSARSLPLAELATIRGGLPSADILPAGRDQATETGVRRALQSRDLAPDGSVAWSSLPLSRAGRNSERFLIYEGDVLLPLRSARPRALVARGVTEDVTAVGQWALITPSVTVLDPDYLAWFLNHPVTAARLGRVMKGGTLPFLPLAEIRAFEVAVPMLAVQRRIVRVDAIHARVSLLERELADARTRLVDAATMNALNHAADPVSATHS